MTSSYFETLHTALIVGNVNTLRELSYVPRVNKRDNVFFRAKVIVTLSLLSYKTFASTQNYFASRLEDLLLE